MLCQSRNIPQAFISPLLRMWLWVCAACSCGRDISCPAWAAAALCPTKIRVDAGLSWEVLLCLSYSFSSGCHDSPLWKSLFILSGNLSCQTSWLVPTESKQIPPLRLEVVGESKPCNNCCLAELWSIEQKSVFFSWEDSIWVKAEPGSEVGDMVDAASLELSCRTASVSVEELALSTVLTSYWTSQILMLEKNKDRHWVNGRRRYCEEQEEHNIQGEKHRQWLKRDREL